MIRIHISMHVPERDIEPGPPGRDNVETVPEALQQLFSGFARHERTASATLPRRCFSHMGLTAWWHPDNLVLHEIRSMVLHSFWGFSVQTLSEAHQTSKYVAVCSMNHQQSVESRRATTARGKAFNEKSVSKTEP